MKDVSEMKVLITGGNGYIGKTLTEKLNKYYDVDSVSRDDFDLTDSHSVNAWFEGKTFDAVLHTAVSGGSRLKKDSFDTVNHNLMMYYNLYGNRDKFSKLINFSSGAEMYAPDEPYGKSKKIISESVKNTDNFFNMKIYGLFDENELDTRFIKSNIIRYIKKEPMIIHTNKVMDFFYMKDLIYLVRYYLYSDEPVSDASCSYKEKYSLLDVTKIINEMDTHTVPIHIKNKFMGEPYCAEDNIPPGDLIGLQKGIEQTYKKLWRLYYEYSYSHGRGW